MSNDHSANWRVLLTSSDWLKVDFFIVGPVAADTSHSGRPTNNSLSLLNARAAAVRGMTVGHVSFRWTCIALQSVDNKL